MSVASRFAIADEGTAAASSVAMSAGRKRRTGANWSAGRIHATAMCRNYCISPTPTAS
nr:hypothetical protein [Streptomyces sp. cf386]